ncbi:hypothetical protein [Clostridium sp.]|uniref:hypothetical protein n=1 Tax=Clostridium sp. TaxID=1506 RepID=UPI0032171588
MNKKNQHTKWRGLDNTAKIFPVITNERLSNVFRVSATLKQEVVPQLLQQALEDIIPWFDGFNVRLRRGFFWYYFETNKKVPVIEKETTYPCKYIDPNSNRHFLFRVSYYEKRINLEVFHAITDGMGAINFLKELTYHYLDLIKSSDSIEKGYIRPSRECILNVEDSYLKNYKKLPKKTYSTKKAYQLKGELLYLDTVSVIHGYVDLPELKKVCKGRGVSITKYLVAVLIWCIYEEYINKQENTNPISINLPINLRSFFESTTTMNFFAVTAIEFLSDGNEHTFEEVLSIVSNQMDENITKEKLQKTISYNVSNEKKLLIRFIPLAFKYIALQFIYGRISKSNTTTLSNLGGITVLPKFQNDIENFHFLIGVSKKQKMKCGVCSYKDKLVVNFTTVLADTYLQRAFFRTLTKEGISVTIESNGVLNEKM